MSATHYERATVYAILRADLFHDLATSVETFVTVKEIVQSVELAQREVARLSALRPDDTVRYWYQETRLFPPGRSAGSADEPA